MIPEPSLLVSDVALVGVLMLAGVGAFVVSGCLVAVGMWGIGRLCDAVERIAGGRDG